MEYSLQVNPSVTKRQKTKWSQWHTTWQQAHTSSADLENCSHWLLGMGAEPSNSEQASECLQEDFQGQKVNRYRKVVSPAAEVANSQPTTGTTTITTDTTTDTTTDDCVETGTGEAMETN